MTVTVAEGQTVTLRELFLDEDDGPLLPHDTVTGPLVTLFDKDQSYLYQGYANVSPLIGEWFIDIPVPKLGYNGRVELEILWTFKDSTLTQHRIRRSLFVEPATENRITDVVIIMDNNLKFDLVLPFQYLPNNGDTVSFSLYLNNSPLYEALSIEDPANTYVTTLDNTMVTMNRVFRVSRLEPHVMIVTRLNPLNGINQTYVYNFWAVTPQIMCGARLLEDYINKARISNVIPELEYTTGDLMNYLHRGLALMNSYQPMVTNFNGLNMQGVLMDAWITCSTYYALGAQLQAEGALAFDFGGQTVNLNIDRTPSIEAALSRVEQQIDNQVKPLKVLLAKNNATGGDGSNGNAISGAGHAFGRLGVINAATTKAGFGTSGINVTGRNFRRYF